MHASNHCTVLTVSHKVQDTKILEPCLYPKLCVCMRVCVGMHECGGGGDIRMCVYERERPGRTKKDPAGKLTFQISPHTEPEVEQP